MLMMKEILLDLLIESPYYGYLAGKVRFVEDTSVKKIRTSFDSAPVVTYNPNWFTSLDEHLKKGAVVHELLHLGLLHFYRRDGREPILWHLACDIAISELMPREQVHDEIVTLDTIYRELALILPPKSTAEDYYDHLSDNETKVDFEYKTGHTEVVFESGKRAETEPLEEMDRTDLNLQALIDELTSIQIAAQSEDALDADLSQKTETAYKGFKLNWRNVLKRFLTGQGRVTTRKSYKRQSRRFDDLPGTKRSIGIRALVAVDESGSVSDGDVADFHKELLRINGINSAHITAVRFDTTCSEPVPLSRFVSENKRLRRGGTDFRPVFALADQLKVPLVILFTDGAGEAPRVVNQKVLWILTGGGKAPVDYGLSIKYMA